jgi:peptide/nickel transport system permease protein
MTDISAAPSEAMPTTLDRLLKGVGNLLLILFTDPQTAIGTLVVLVFLLVALFGPSIAPYTENDQKHPVSEAPGGEYPFGTDRLGRDVYSRVILGTRSIFEKAGIGTVIAVILGTTIGLVIGYSGGWLDEAVSRVIDAVLALPAMLIALVLLGILKSLDISQGSLAEFLADNSVLIVIALVYVPIVARVVRSRALEIKTRQFVQAAQIRGEGIAYILFREIFPSAIPTLVVEASLRFSYAIFLVAALGFLGIGASPPSPDWGLMVNENRGGFYALAPWALNYPAAAIALLVVGVNLMSDGFKRLVQKSG